MAAQYVWLIIIVIVINIIIFIILVIFTVRYLRWLLSMCSWSGWRQQHWFRPFVPLCWSRSARGGFFHSPGIWIWNWEFGIEFNLEMRAGIFWKWFQKYIIRTEVSKITTTAATIVFHLKVLNLLAKVCELRKEGLLFWSQFHLESEIECERKVSSSVKGWLLAK